MSQITILGLGPGEWKHLTLEAVEVLNNHEEVWLRTRHHPLVAQMPIQLAVHSFDEWYDEADEFALLYERIAKEVVRLGERKQGVLYAVPGNPSVGESTVGLIRLLAKEAQIPVHMIEGLSFIAPSLATVNADALDGLQIADATVIAHCHYPPFDADRPVLIAQVYNNVVASNVKLTLLELYPPTHVVTLLHGAGTSEAESLTCELHELDHQADFAYLTSLWVPPLPKPSSLPYLQNIVAHLRAPEGCPWDREQDHHSLRRSILEEAYEVVDAIDRESPTDLYEELGDLLLNITMNAQIASEGGEFSMVEVIRAISEKLIRRHPHVFGSITVNDSGQVVQNWEAIKAAERAAKADSATIIKDEFDEVPLAMPALTRASKIGRKAMRKGWRVPDAADAFATWQQTPNGSTLGDLLLTLTMSARKQKEEAEVLLQEAVKRLVAQQRG